LGAGLLATAAVPSWRWARLLTWPTLGFAPDAHPPMLTSTTTEQSLGNSFSIPVAVLPFSTLSARDASRPPIGERVSNELRGYLSRNSLLRVASLDVTRHIEVAVSNPSRWSKAGVRYIVTGSVEEGPKKLRLRMDVTDVSNNFHVWSDELEYASD